MYINKFDNFFNQILDNFNNYLINKKFFEEIKDNNFVKYMDHILKHIEIFVKSISKKEIMDIIKEEIFLNNIYDIIKRYCAFYVYLGIAYYYKGNRDLFITNIIEISRFQKDATYQIPNFYNSTNNSMIISYFNDIKNIIQLSEFKSMDKIKIILVNNPLKYDSTIELFNELGEDYIIDYFLVKDNFHNIIKTLIFKQIYLKEDKNDLLNIINIEEKKDLEYKYIEIVTSNQQKIIDFNIIQNFVILEKLYYKLSEEIYEYLEENRDNKEILIKENQDYINYLFDNNILVPITEDFLRYHKDIEKYDKEKKDNIDIKERDSTKIKYIINKINNVKNYYSPLLEKNPKLKLETENLFYKQMSGSQNKLVVLYNENEEIKIIQKLENSQNVNDYDLLIDLINIRKYNYVNFKHFKKDGIKIRPNNTIQGIRSTNLNQKKEPLELRIGNNSIDMNIIGIAFNPSKIPLDCFNTTDIIDVRKITKKENGFKAFNKIMEKSFDNKNSKLYYWTFDNSKDIPDINKYVEYNKDNTEKNIKIMLEQIYNNYSNLVYNKINKYFNSIKKTNKLTISDFNKIMRNYNNNVFDFNLNVELKNNIIENVLLNNINEIDIIPDDIDNIIPGRNEQIIKLPSIKKEKQTSAIIKLNEEEIGSKIDISKINYYICYHYIKWKDIMKMSKNSDMFNQSVFEFVKQYVKTNKNGDFICKSCNEMVQIQKYVFEGTYSEEGDTFLTTSIAVTQNLEDMPKYSKYMKSIRNIEKNIEKFAYTLNLVSYMGNMPVVRLRRKMIIKDTIDLILLHTEWLKSQPKNRIEQFSNKYGINKDLTNLFFFELKDDIFITSSTDTDYYKIIKYNNIMAYLIYIILSDLNSGQILSLKQDKKYNFLYFKNIKDTLFGNMYIRINMKDKISILNIPLLAYLLYYFSGIMISNRFWLYNDDTEDPKKKLILQINLQKTIIHTVVDMINSIAEANYETNKNFLYEIINTRFLNKITHIYNDTQLLKRYEILSMKDINYDETTKKVTFTVRKVPLININTISEYFQDNNLIRNKQSCEISTNYIKTRPIVRVSNNFDSLTNCEDGKFHKWEFKDNDLICSLCNKSYNKLKSKYTTTSSEEENTNFVEKLKLIYLQKLSLKYCVSGILHEVDKDNICIKCKQDLNKLQQGSKLSDKELKEMEKNITKKIDETKLEMYKKLEEETNLNYNLDNDIKKILNKISKRYDDMVKDSLENYVIEFVNRLTKILGVKIKINENTIYLKENIYIIDHDYMGNTIKNPYTVLTSDDKIKLQINHPSLNKDVLYYKDKSHNIYVYYDSITLQYIGYSSDNKVIKKNRNNVALKIIYSIKDCILMLGYKNLYIDVDTNDKQNILNVIRNRMNNLKQLIERTQTILFSIINKSIKTSQYNIEEKEIINEYTKRINKINMTDKEGHNTIFKHHKIINHRLFINYNVPEKIELNNNYLYINNLNNLGNSDCKLIFYLIYNLNQLLDYNNTNIIETEIASLIVKIIKYLFNIYYINNSSYDVRRFGFLINNDLPYVDESIQIVGIYNELLSQAEIDDPEKKESEYDAKEAKDSLDMDDYEVNDEEDEAVEALHGFDD